MEDSKLNPFVRIRGVKGRGSEVIAELEKRGGEQDTLGVSGECTNQWYYISMYGFIASMEVCYDEGFFSENYEEITLPRWRAEKGEKYYHFDSLITIVSDREMYSSEDDVRYVFSNYAKTAEELEPLRERFLEMLKER